MTAFDVAFSRLPAGCREYRAALDLRACRALCARALMLLDGEVWGQAADVIAQLEARSLQAASGLVQEDAEAPPAGPIEAGATLASHGRRLVLDASYRIESVYGLVVSGYLDGPRIRPPLGDLLIGERDPLVNRLTLTAPIQYAPGPAYVAWRKLHAVLRRLGSLPIEVAAAEPLRRSA